MDKNFNEKIKTDNLSCEMLCSILNCCYYPSYFNRWHEESKEYHDEFEKEFLNQLSCLQQKDFETLQNIKTEVESTTSVYNILYGMKLKSALDKLIEEPLKVLDLYDSKGTDIREIYHSVKQKKEDLLNE